MAHTRADKAVAAVIDGLATWALGTNLFYGHSMPSHPDQVVYCLLRSGTAPIDFHPAPGRSGYEPSDLRPRVQVIIRDKIGALDTGADLAEEIRTTLHLAEIAGYMDCRVTESQPNDLGPDEDGRPEWSINVDLRVSD